MSVVSPIHWTKHNIFSVVSLWRQPFWSLCWTTPRLTLMSVVLDVHLMSSCMRICRKWWWSGLNGLYDAAYQVTWEKRLIRSRQMKRKRERQTCPLRWTKMKDRWCDLFPVTANIGHGRQQSRMGLPCETSFYCQTAIMSNVVIKWWQSGLVLLAIKRFRMCLTLGKAAHTHTLTAGDNTDKCTHHTTARKGTFIPTMHAVAAVKCIQNSGRS